MKYPITTIQLDNGEEARAHAPYIISASWATDVPAFYSDWFFNRLEAGYAAWHNPHSRVKSYVSFENARFVVFWSKNPKPLLRHIHKLKDYGLRCYIHYTVNDYSAEQIEPNLPSLNQRIDTFRKLSTLLGKEAVIWRNDPLILTDTISVDVLLDRMKVIGDQLWGYTNKLVFSFVNIGSYKKVGRNLESAKICYNEWTEEHMTEFATKLSALNNQRWNFELATCAEGIDLDGLGIKHNRCIDPDLIVNLSPNDEVLHTHIEEIREKRGMRSHCGCTVAKDIGEYNTCAHACTYCFANNTPKYALRQCLEHKEHPWSEALTV